MVRKNFWAFLISVGLFPAVALAQTAPAPVPATQAPAATPAAASAKPPVAIIGTVDVQEVIRQSTAGKSLVQQADQRQKALQAEYTKQQQALRAQQQQILSQRAALSAADFKKKEDELQAAVKKLQDDSEKKRQAFEVSFANARKQIIDQLAKILPDLATQRGFTIVLNKTDVVVSDDRFDLTAESLKRLNAVMTSVKMQ